MTDPANPQEVAEHYVELQKELANDPAARWILRVKELRARHGVGIMDAQKMALEDPSMRRWALKMMNSNRQCQKQALAHIRDHGGQSLIEQEGLTFRFRDGVF